jgi:hypothetical protein
MSEQDPHLEPGQEQRLRALLAELGSGTDHEADKLPPEIANRLDDTLAGLVAEREAEKISEEHTATGKVVPLRPRWMPRVAAAAAAVIVLGLGALTWANLGHLGDGVNATSSDAGAGSAQSEQAPTASSPGGVTSSGKAARAPEPTPVLRAATFPQDVRALLVHTPSLRSPTRLHGELSGTSPGKAPASLSLACSGPPVKDGSNVTLVRLDATPAALVVHPARKGRSLVEAWSCDGTRRLASTTVAP